ncbi:MAG: hypothetical protein ACD_23C00882G0001 [uncultured bacterium]|nr:MAG: hypothetical protein ACD_23C00882G0001 [uncultured bacterium]
MKDGMEHVQVRIHGGLEHINLTTADGDPVPHATGRRLQPNVARVVHDVDWWRTPDTRQSLLHKLIYAIKHKWFRRRG